MHIKNRSVTFATVPPARPLKVLVVDDQGPVGEIISRVASQSGWRAYHSVSADRLDERIEHDEIDVIMLDYAIDGNPWSPHNGMSVLRGLREKGLQVPAILFSGWTNRIDSQEARALGVVAVLEKPLCVQELRHSLETAARAMPTTAPASQPA
jgi:CheY-like chemotaxis protein